MQYPILDIEYLSWNSGVLPERLTQQILKSLVTFPYFIRLTGFPLNHEALPLISIVERLAVETNSSNKKPVSFTKVRINPDQANRDRVVTAYSRTHLALPAHTDSSYMPNPHDLVTFQCEQHDTNGGETFLVPVDTVISRLSTKSRSVLEESQFNFGRNIHAILDTKGTIGKTKNTYYEIRYYREQLSHVMERDGSTLNASACEALKELDAILAEPSNAFHFKLLAGEAVMMNNKRVMHGRTGFTETSDRLIYRIRHHLNLETFSPAKKGIFGFLLSRSKELVSEESNAEPTLAPDVNSGKLSVGFKECVAEGKKLVKVGRFKEAMAAYKGALEHEPEDYRCLLAMSALEYKLGMLAMAEERRRIIAEQHPFVPIGKQNSGRKTILRVRSLKNIKYSLQKGSKGYYHESLQRGHFSLSSLLDDRRYNCIQHNGYDETIQETKKLPTIDLILNTVSCGDRMKESLQAIDVLVKKYNNIPVINHPKHVIAASRVGNYERLKDLDALVFPKTIAVTIDRNKIEVQAQENILGAGLTLPIIMRPQFTHTGSGMALVRSFDELVEYLYQNHKSIHFYGIQWHDHADERGLYNKIRILCIDGRYYPIAHLMHNEWNVHSGDRYSVMDKNLFLQDMEKRFLADMPAFLGATALNAFNALKDVMKLDFFGVDFTLLPDGRPYIFECNAAMRHNFDHAGAFPYTRPTLIAASKAFDDMISKRLM
ncbi:TauD/TfdA family dioxygenase [Kordiimonas pumila]|uniref:TauD/TfdA family dioxygenase n=1 Tax=Kordiimonas pumila TaxID=2161677 RepID=A0ABV7D241_9PROT|nr:TauD/TfdA family dioxygenase [Kordiimonas pumila]